MFIIYVTVCTTLYILNILIKCGTNIIMLGGHDLNMGRSGTGEGGGGGVHNIQVTPIEYTGSAVQFEEV
jgi:hypothetical protein